MTRVYDPEVFRDARALVTGGLGFIGSNLAIRLAEHGAQVTILDAMIPGFGANPFNIAPVADRVVVCNGDIRDPGVVGPLVVAQDFLFHLAGQVDHVHSLVHHPYDDIDMNVKGTAVVLEACKHANRDVRIVYTGTRGQYGKPDRLPVSEDAPTRPLGVYEITNLAAEKMMEAYRAAFGIRTISLRISNVYGPRAQMRHSRYGVVNWFVRLAMDDETIPVFGTGEILRDFLYVDDCVDAVLACAAGDVWGEVFNVGVDRPTNFRDLAEAVCRAAGRGRWELAPFSPERLAQEPGDFYSDVSKIRRMLGWSPKIELDEGLARTVAYYREHRGEYW